MDPTIAKAGAKAAVQSQYGQAEAQKTAPSKFDMLRADLNEKLAAKAQVPPQVTEISEEQKRLLQNDLRRRLDTGSAKTPDDLFRGEMTSAKAGIESLHRRIAGIPPQDAFQPLRQRLKSIEADFAESGRLLGKVRSLDNPNELLNVQMQMYKLTQNVEVLSKVVDQVNSGIKTMLQIQV